MEIVYTESFFESLKKLQYYDSWYNKTKRFLNHGIKRFFKNIYIFRRELYRFEPWDYSYNLELFRISLEQTANYLEKYGYEEDTSRNKKIKKIRRAIELLNNELEDNYIDQARKILKIDNDNCYDEEVIDLSHKLDQDQWEELWQIIKGKQCNKNIKTPYKKWFDGSSMRGWWD